MATGRSAMSTRLASLAQNPKEVNRSRATRQGIWCGLSSQQARNKASTWDEYSCEPVAPSTSKRNKAGCRESAIDSVPRYIAAMAIATRSEWDMLTTPPKPRNKERPFLPGMNDRGVLGRSEEHTSELQSRENLVCRL